MAESPIKIILVGKTGCGKSSTGNFILEKKIFKSKGGNKSITKEITLAETLQGGRRIKVVDTPGLFDTDQKLIDTALKMQTSVEEVSPGPHAFLIVLHGNARHTKEEEETQCMLQLTFGATILKHAIIILTHEDEFVSSEELLMEAKSAKEIQSLIQLCDGRCITLNSLSTDSNYIKEKLKNIIKEVDAISQNGKVWYTEDLKPYTQRLKEQAKKKTANENLTAGLLAKYLENAAAETKRHAEDAAESKRKAKAADESTRQVQADFNKYKVRTESEEKNKLRTGMMIGAVGAASVIGLGAIGLGGMIISKNPQIFVNALKFGVEVGATMLEEKRKDDHEDMHSNRKVWVPTHFSEAQRLFLQQSPDKFFSFNGK